MSRPQRSAEPADPLDPAPPAGSTAPADPPGGRRAVAVWTIAVAVYFVAVLLRTSLGVAGLDAADRFAVGASALSAFPILQLLVYAAMQIPVGVMVDRLGSRRVLILGLSLLITGQLGFAFAPTYGSALAARAVLGCGDAMTFLAVLRLGNRWFPAHRAPMMAQLTGLAGMTGNLTSTLVLSRVLEHCGWVTAFAGSALGGLLVLVPLLLFLRDQPPGRAPEPRPAAGRGAVRRQIGAAWREPGTRLGMWTHFTTQCPAMVFLMLWGLPFLVESQGYARVTAGELLTLVVATSLLLGLPFGWLLSRRPGARLPVVLTVTAAVVAVWTTAIWWPADRTPGWLVILLCVVLGGCVPASTVGFDFARLANPPQRHGTASGIVNIGGFTASMLALLAVGLLLDATGDDYRIALSVVLGFVLLGVTRILRLHGRAVRRERERHPSPTRHPAPATRERTGVRAG
ncbi:MFS transporter [Streptomyces ginkgonis]|uniref:MFS transporter n=1 Tax=Streptomyces ginkgonis TaxID=1812259 RepID=UPI002176B9F6|nr:MFS transporter [Streptomyces ginkgonis]